MSEKEIEGKEKTLVVALLFFALVVIFAFFNLTKGWRNALPALLGYAAMAIIVLIGMVSLVILKRDGVPKK